MRITFPRYFSFSFKKKKKEKSKEQRLASERGTIQGRGFLGVERLIAAGVSNQGDPVRANEGGIQRAAFDKRQAGSCAAWLRSVTHRLPAYQWTRPRATCSRSTASPSLSLSLFRPAAQGRLIPARLQKIDFTNANHRARWTKVNGARCTNTREIRCVRSPTH